jgi:photosystem II stability/assembly factor-like uncharacterized protein
MKYRFAFACGCVLALAAWPAHAQDADMRLLTSSSGWVSTGNHLLWTSTSGQQWTEVTPPGTRSLHSVFFLDTSHGWVLESTTNQALEMARTADGGQHWTVSVFPLSAEDAARVGGPAALDFIDALHGWAMLRQTASSNFSLGILFSTSDGGQTWTKLPPPPLGDPVRFVTKSDGWLAGGPTGNRLYMTRDGGRTWSSEPLALPAGISPQASVRYRLPAFTSEHDGLLAVRYTWSNNSALVLEQTNDGGAHWNPRMVLAGPASENYPAVSLVDSHVVRVATDPAGVLTTTVDESSAVSDGTISPEASVLSADFVSTSRGWIMTSEGHCTGYKTGCSQQERVFATMDTGKTFREITPGALQAVPVAESAFPFSTVIGSGEGMDLCDPSTSGLGTWYKDSPYHYVNVYIGGNNAACPQPGLSTSWVSTVVGQGWGLIPTWVGPQAPCTSCTSCGKFSSTPNTAASQAVSQAKSAASKMSSIGLKGTIVYYDMEYYNDNASCSAATKAFINSWVNELHTLGYKGAVYGSPTNANADWTSVGHPPDDVWLALWNGVASVWNLSPLPNSYWSHNQRIHQYTGGVNQTYGGVKYNIDQDFLAGPVAK